jgi:hypothetical protein
VHNAAPRGELNNARMASKLAMASNVGGPLPIFYMKLF